MKQFILLPIIIIAAFIIPQVQSQVSCDVSPQNDQFTTGSYVFVLAVPFVRKSCFNLPSNGLVQSSTQISYGISNILSYANQNGLDYSLRAHINSANNSISFVLVLNNNTWNRISISYLLSNRIEFISGSVIADGNDFLDCKEAASTSIAIELNRFVGEIRGSAILIFINGIRSPSSSLDIQMFQPLIDVKLNQINVTFSTITPQPIELIFLNYLIIDLSKLSTQYTYSFNTGSIQSDFSISGIISITSSSSSVQYAYAHFNKTNKFTCSGFNCDSCQSAQTCRNSNANIYNNRCLRCSINEVFSAAEGCVCKVGFYYINKVCGVCQEGTNYNRERLVCEWTCGSNEVSWNGRCICNNGFYNISGTCRICASGTLYSALLSQCVSRCTNGQQWINEKCSCPNGTNLIGNACGQCPPGTFYVAQSTSCMNICNTPNTAFVNGECKCMNGFDLVNGQCKIVGTSSNNCANNKYLINGQCRCLNAFFQYQGSCYSCPPNSSPTIIQDGCLCHSGYILANLSCVLPNSDTTSSSNTGTTSSSSTGTTSSSNTGTTSSSNTALTSASSANSASTSSGGLIINSGGSTGSQTSSSSSSTVSNNGSSSTASNNGSSTSSNSGITIINNPSLCPLNSFLINNQCVCSPNFYIINGNCDKCPSTNFYNGAKCEPCKENCKSCMNKNICSQCNEGFLLIYPPILEILETNCAESCGDGRRYVLACDDENNVNGDGCSSTCSIEMGWSCLGGSSTSKDACKLLTSGTASLTFLKNIRFINAVYQNVMISHLPDNITANNCQFCNNLLKVELLTSPPSTTLAINFIKNTLYQYVVAVVLPPNFNQQLSTNNVITMRATINPLYEKYFTTAEMNIKSTISLDLWTIPILNIDNGLTKAVGSENLSLGQQAGEKGQQDEEIRYIFEEFLNK